MARLPQGGLVLYLVGMLALLPVVVMAVVTIHIANQALEEEAQGRIQASAHSASIAIEQELQRLSDFTVVLSERPELRRAIDSGDPAQIQWHLASLSDDFPSFSVAGVVDPEGKLLAVVPETPSALGQSYAHRDWYRGAVLTRGPYVSEVFRTDATGQPFVVAAAIATPSRDGQPGHGPIVVVAVTVAALQSYIEDYSRQQNLEIVLTDQAGTVVSADLGPPNRLAFADAPSVDAALAGQSTLEVVETSEGRRHSYTTPISGLGWTVTTSAPTEDSTTLWLRSVIIVLACVLAAMILAGLFILERVLQRRSETLAELARSEALLDSVFDNIPVMISVKDAETLTYLRINKLTEEVMGKGRSEVLGRTSSEVYPQVADQQVGQQDQAVLTSGRVVQIREREIVGPSGPLFVNCTKVPLFDPDGSLRHLLSIFEDVTESLADKKEIQKAIVEAERANAAKSEFLSRMSHELRTPLNAILGFGQLLELDDLSVDQKEYVGQIIRGGQHLLSLVNEILDLARIETGRLSLSLEPVDLEEIIHDSFGLMRPLAKQTGITLLDLATPNGQQLVRADQQRVKQVVINLISNAIKYNKPGGQVEVRCVADARGFVRLSITDNGPGIAPEDVDRIFNPFERLEAEHTQIEGSGLGLAFCKNVVEAMGGIIGVETAVDSGSTFWIELSLVTHPTMPFKLDAVTNGGEEGGELAATDTTIPAVDVVCIDDISSNRQLIESLLASNPEASLRLAADGKEGLRLIADRRPDVVLLDLNLPGMTGKDVLRTLRNDPETRSIPVIVVSADATASRIEGLGRVRADDYIAKPVDIVTLARTLRRLAPVSAV